MVEEDFGKVVGKVVENCVQQKRKMICFEWGYLLSLLDQLSNLALNSLVVET
jgi:hypothetical protein